MSRTPHVTARTAGPRQSASARNAASPQAASSKAASPQVVRRRKTVGIAAAMVVALVASASALVWPGFAMPTPEPTPTVTVTAPHPTPTVAPSPREGEQTALTDALPDAVMAFAQAGIVELDAWHEEFGAIEAWTFTYREGDAPGAATIVVDIGQWATAERALAFRNEQVSAAGTAILNGDVLVGDEVVGQYALVPDAAFTPDPNANANDGGSHLNPGTLWWSNGTVVLAARGRIDLIEAFYSAFPL